jgi:MOSC domain-containing protein YiiM
MSLPSTTTSNSAAVVQVSVSNGGVPKYPVLQAHVGKLGLEGDRQAHPQFHGGVRQAVLMICAEAIEELQAAGWPVYFGALGENITVRGLDRRMVRVGQRYRVGAATLEITKLRQPCKQLDPYGEGIQKAVFDKQVKAGDATSPRWGLAGFYASVVEPGVVGPGDPVTLVAQAV